MYQDNCRATQAPVALKHELDAVIRDYACLACHRRLQRTFPGKQLQERLYEQKTLTNAGQVGASEHHSSFGITAGAADSSHRVAHWSTSPVALWRWMCCQRYRRMLQAVKSGTSAKGPGCNVEDARAGCRQRRRSRTKADAHSA